jgi:hypothetical protein
MKRLATIIAALGIMTMANVASAYEFTPGQICQFTDYDTNAPVVTYNWPAMYAGANQAYVICPIPRTYNSVSSAIAYVYNPSGSTFWGYLNFVNTDGTYTNFNSASTTTAGNTTLGFSAINTGGYNGFVNFELYVPAGGAVRGFFTN